MAAGLGCSVVVSLIMTIGGGLLLDRAVGTSPLFTLIGVALGLIAAGYQLYELTRVGVKGRTAGPLGRQLARLPRGRTTGTGPRPSGSPGNDEE